MFSGRIRTPEPSFHGSLTSSGFHEPASTAASTATNIRPVQMVRPVQVVRPVQKAPTNDTTTPSPASSVGSSQFPISSSPWGARGSVAYRYGILGNNLQRMRSNTSMSGAGSSGNPARLTRSSSITGPIPGVTQHVEYNGQDYFTTMEPLFDDGSFLLNKVGGTDADALLGKPLPDGGWDAHPARNIGVKYVTLGDQKYETSPLPTFDSGTYQLYPISPSGAIQANDAIEAVLLPDNRWAVVVPNQNYPQSASPPAIMTRSPTPLDQSSASSTRSPTPLTQSSTPSPPSSRDQTPSRQASPANAATTNKETSFFPSLWRRIKNIFN